MFTSLFNKKYYQPNNWQETYQDCTVWLVMHENFGRKLVKTVMIKHGRHIWEINYRLFKVLPQDLNADKKYELTIYWKKDKIDHCLLFSHAL